MSYRRLINLFSTFLLISGGVTAQLLSPGELPIPAASREWNGADYEVVATALRQGRLALPRFGDKATASLMRRMVSVENLKSQSRGTIPLEYRFPDYIKLSVSMGQILRHYGEASQRGEDVHAELAALLAHLVRVSARGIKLSDEWMAIAPRDEKFASRQQGVETMKSGVSTMLMGTVMSLGEAMYDANDKSLMLAAIAESIDSLQVAVPQNVKQQLRTSLLEAKGLDSRADLENVRRILDALAD